MNSEQRLRSYHDRIYKLSDKADRNKKLFMDYNEKEALYSLKNIRIIISSKGINISSGEIKIYSKFFVIICKIKKKDIKIFYKDISFNAIEKQKKLIILCDIKKYDIINISCNTEEEACELFNQICIYIKEDDIINDSNFELDEELNK